MNILNILMISSSVALSLNILWNVYFGTKKNILKLILILLILLAININIFYFSEIVLIIYNKIYYLYSVYIKSINKSNFLDRILKFINQTEMHLLKIFTNERQYISLGFLFSISSLYLVSDNYIKRSDLISNERIISKFLHFICISILTLGLYPIFAMINVVYESNKSRTKLTLLRGQEVFHKPRSGLQIVSKEFGKNGSLNGLEVYPGLRVPSTIERLNFLLTGGMGSGKTNWIMNTLSQCYERNDLSLVLDVKGDFAEVYGGKKDVIIFGPCDARSPAWDIAQDVATKIEAQQFGANLIPKNDGPNAYFTNSARDILVGAITILQKQKPLKWTFKDLQILMGSEVKLYKLLMRFHPGAIQILGQCKFSTMTDEEGNEHEVLEANRTARAILGDIRSHLQLIDYLALAWANIENKFSIRNWILGKSEERIVIVQFRERYKDLSQFFAGTIFDFFFKEVLSLPDSSDRILGCFMDELGFLPRIPSFISAVRSARSKGLRLYVGVQETGIIETTYKEDGGKEAVVNGFGNKLVGRGETPEYAEYWQRMFGKNTYTKKTLTRSRTEGRVQTTESEGEVEQHALQTGDLLSLPPASLKNGATFFTKFSGCPIVKLTWPIFIQKKLFLAVEPALWLQRPEITENLDVSLVFERDAKGAHHSDGFFDHMDISNLPTVTD